MTLFDYDFLKKRASRCETNHFHIVIEDEMEWPFEKNDARRKGLFMHEYIHYIQHLSTLCGISLSMQYNRMFIEYRDYFEKHETITLPLLLGESIPHISRFLEYFNKIKGSRVYSNRIDNIRFSENAVIEAEDNWDAVAMQAYNDESKQWDMLNTIKVGYYAIVESMADMIQRIYDPEVKHEECPYLVVKKICELEYHEISKDYRMMVAICICALMYSNPGVGLFKAITYSKQHPELNGYLLYRCFMRDNSIRTRKGEEITIHEMFRRQLAHFKDTLLLVFGGELGYYSKAIDNAIIGATSGNNILLSLLYDERILPDQYICELADFYGYPFIESYNLTLWPGEKERAIDSAVAVGFELLYKRFSCKVSTECPRADRCKRIGEYQYECKYDQWNHIKPLCLFTASMHYFHLEGKNIETDHSLMI